MAELVSVGLSFLNKLGDALDAGPEDSPVGRAAGGRRSPTRTPVRAAVRTDEETGDQYLKLPMPEPETIQKIADLLTRFASGG